MRSKPLLITSALGSIELSKTTYNNIEIARWLNLGRLPAGDGDLGIFRHRAWGFYSFSGQWAPQNPRRSKDEYGEGEVALWGPLSWAQTRLMRDPLGGAPEPSRSCGPQRTTLRPFSIAEWAYIKWTWAELCFSSAQLLVCGLREIKIHQLFYQFNRTNLIHNIWN